jgi:hypothetical protein
MPMTVSCGPIPKRVPNDPLKVTELKLYTSPAKPVCGKPFRLVAEFHTNKPGKVNFTLHRHDGEKQNASVEVGAVKGGFAKRWWKEYVYKVRRALLQGERQGPGSSGPVGAGQAHLRGQG